MKSDVVHDKLALVSHFAGRVRVRAETFRVLPEVGEEVVSRLLEQDGVESAHASPVTGSVLVTYDPTVVDLPKLVRLIVQAGALQGIALEPAPLPPPSGGRRMRSSLHAFNLHVNRKSKGALDLKMAVPVALTGSGLLMLARGARRVPEWYDLMFWGFVAFCNLHPPNFHPSGGSQAETDDAVHHRQ